MALVPNQSPSVIPPERSQFSLAKRQQAFPNRTALNDPSNPQLNVDDPSFLASMGLRVKRGFTQGGLVVPIGSALYRSYLNWEDDEEKLSPEKANELYGIPGLVEFDSPVTREAASFSQQYALKKAALDKKIDNRSRGSGFMGDLMGFGAEIGGSMLDPANAATMFIPVIGTGQTVTRTGFRGMVQRVGSKGISFRTRAQLPGPKWAAPFVEGAIEGSVGSFGGELLLMGAERSMDVEYDPMGLVVSPFFGGFVGTGLGLPRAVWDIRRTSRYNAAMEKVLTDNPFYKTVQTANKEFDRIFPEGLDEDTLNTVQNEIVSIMTKLSKEGRISREDTVRLDLLRELLDQQTKQVTRQSEAEGAQTGPINTNAPDPAPETAPVGSSVSGRETVEIDGEKTIIDFGPEDAPSPFVEPPEGATSHRPFRGSTAQEVIVGPDGRRYYREKRSFAPSDRFVVDRETGDRIYVDENGNRIGQRWVKAGRRFEPDTEGVGTPVYEVEIEELRGFERRAAERRETQTQLSEAESRLSELEAIKQEVEGRGLSVNEAIQRELDSLRARQTELTAKLSELGSEPSRKRLDLGKIFNAKELDLEALSEGKVVKMKRKAANDKARATKLRKAKRSAKTAYEKMIAKLGMDVFGVDVYFHDVEGDTGNLGYNVKGSPRTVVLSSNLDFTPGTGSFRSVLHVLGHESFHSIKRRNPELWQELVKTMRQSASRHYKQTGQHLFGDIVDRTIMSYEGFGHLDGGVRADEVYANIFGQLIDNAQFRKKVFSEMEKNDLKGLQKIARLLGKLAKGIMDNLRRWFTSDPVGKQVNDAMNDLAESVADILGRNQEALQSQTEASPVKPNYDRVYGKAIIGIHNRLIELDRLVGKMDVTDLELPDFAVTDRSRETPTIYGRIKVNPNLIARRVDRQIRELTNQAKDKAMKISDPKMREKFMDTELMSIEAQREGLTQNEARAQAKRQAIAYVENRLPRNGFTLFREATRSIREMEDQINNLLAAHEHIKVMEQGEPLTAEDANGVVHNLVGEDRETQRNLSNMKKALGKLSKVVDHTYMIEGTPDAKGNSTGNDPIMVFSLRRTGDFEFEVLSHRNDEKPFWHENRPEDRGASSSPEEASERREITLNVDNRDPKSVYEEKVALSREALEQFWEDKSFADTEFRDASGFDEIMDNINSLLPLRVYLDPKTGAEKTAPDYNFVNLTFGQRRELIQNINDLVLAMDRMIVEKFPSKSALRDGLQALSDFESQNIRYLKSPTKLREQFEVKEEKLKKEKDPEVRKILRQFQPMRYRIYQFRKRYAAYHAEVTKARLDLDFNRRANDAYLFLESAYRIFTNDFPDQSKKKSKGPAFSDEVYEGIRKTMDGVIDRSHREDWPMVQLLNTFDPDNYSPLDKSQALVDVIDFLDAFHTYMDDVKTQTAMVDEAYARSQDLDTSSEKDFIDLNKRAIADFNRDLALAASQNDLPRLNQILTKRGEYLDEVDYNLKTWNDQDMAMAVRRELDEALLEGEESFFTNRARFDKERAQKDNLDRLVQFDSSMVDRTIEANDMMGGSVDPEAFQEMRMDAGAMGDRAKAAAENIASTLKPLVGSKLKKVSDFMSKHIMDRIRTEAGKTGQSILPKVFIDELNARARDGSFDRIRFVEDRLMPALDDMRKAAEESVDKKKAKGKKDTTPELPPEEKMLRAITIRSYQSLLEEIDTYLSSLPARELAEKAGMELEAPERPPFLGVVDYSQVIKLAKLRDKTARPPFLVTNTDVEFDRRALEVLAPYIRDKYLQWEGSQRGKELGVQLSQSGDGKTIPKARIARNFGSWLGGKLNLGMNESGLSLQRSMELRQSNSMIFLKDTLDRHGLFHKWKSNDPELMDKVAHALEHPGDFSDPVAREIADAIIVSRKAVMKQFNDAGGTITWRDGYIAGTVFDQKLIRSNRKAYEEFLLDNLDWAQIARFQDRPLGSVRQKEAYVKAAVAAILEDPKAKFGDDIDESLISIGLQHAHRRQLIFKPGAWWEHDKQFGSGGHLANLTNQQIQKIARRSVVMENLGSTPIKAFRDALDAAGLSPAEGPGKRLMGQLMHLTEQLDHTLDPGVSQLGGTARKIGNIFMLQQSGITAGISDQVSAWQNFQRFDPSMRMVEYSGRMLRHMWRSAKYIFSKNDEVAQRERAYWHARLAGLHAQLSSSAERLTGSLVSGTKAVDNVHDLLFNINGMNFVTEIAEMSNARMVHESIITQLESGRIDPNLERLFQQYGIRKEDYGYILKHKTTSPAGFLSIDFLAMSDGNIKRKLSNMLLNEMRDAVTHATLEDQAFFRFGTKGGTWKGEAVRVATQYMPMMLSSARRFYDRFLWQQGMDNFKAWVEAGGPGKLQLFQLAAMQIFQGWLIVNIKEMLKGREPIHFMDGRQWNGFNFMYILDQSGVIPYLHQIEALLDGDFKELTGPVPSYMIKQTSAMASFETQKMVQSGINMTPFTNLPGVRRPVQEIMAFLLGDLFETEAMDQFYFDRGQSNIYHSIKH